MASNSPWHYLYKTKRWLDLRRAQLLRQPLCEMHLALGRVVPATIADHKTPHKGDEQLFFEGELQSLCKYCHDSHKQREEKGGGPAEVDANGFRLDGSWG